MRLFCLLISALLILGCWRPSWALDVPLTVKEVAGVGAEQYPITAVVPLPRGEYQWVSDLWVSDAEDQPVPAQVDVLNRWWAQDNSIRHVRVIFPATVPAGGDVVYRLRDGVRPPHSPLSLQVADSAAMVVVDTGRVRFVVNKTNFRVFDYLWYDADGNGRYSGSEQVIGWHPENGLHIQDRFGEQQPSLRDDVTVEVEEAGDYYAVIKASAPTVFGPQHVPGFAVRIYAWAGQAQIKVDVQLQNSDKSVKFSAPFYFESMGLSLRVSSARGAELAEVRVTGPEVYEGDKSLSVPGVTAAIRYAWETWPNGYRFDGRMLHLDLFPEWSQQWMVGGFTDTGLYWLDDMQHVYKEVLFDFSGRGAELAETFTYPPVAVVPQSWYRETAVTVDMGGFIPETDLPPVADKRKPTYPAKAYDVTGKFYNFGWDNFLVDIHRKVGAAQGGGWPYSGEEFIYSGNPADYFLVEQGAIGELNVRPQWLAGYTDADWEFLRLTQAPYADWSWRAYETWPVRLPYIAIPYLEGTAPLSKPRDDEHGWFYHVEQSYYHTANPWVKDWYEFIAEFRRVAMQVKDRYPDRNTRARAHKLGQALQAFRVTGNQALWGDIEDYVLSLRGLQDGEGNIHPKRVDSAIWLGYLSRQLIGYMVEADDFSGPASEVVHGLMRLNHEKIKFSYNIALDNYHRVSSSRFAMGLADPLAWYIQKYNRYDYTPQFLQYINVGLGGATGYTRMDETGLTWDGGWHGRWVQEFLK